MSTRASETLDFPSPRWQTVDLPPEDEWRILVVDDDEDDALIVEELLRSGHLGCVSVDWRSCVADGLEALCANPYTLCIVDFRMGPDSGLRFISVAQRTTPGVPVILLTGDGSRDVDIAAMNAGAADFLSKADLTVEGLERSVRYAAREARRRATLLRMARRDPLTGLHNRPSIEERLVQATQRALRRQSTMAVMMLDLDGFKAVNDTLGHAAGDRLLEIVAERLKSVLRGYDVVGRIGGDEFVAVVEDLDGTGEAQQVAERLVEVVRPPFEMPGAMPAVSASVGYVCFPGPVARASDLLQAADRAMYAAKAKGKARAHALTSTTDLGQLRLTSQVCVQGAIARNELRLALQPQVDLVTGATVGLECLVRWKPKGFAECPPSGFLSALERSGAIATLDSWVLQRAIELQARLAPHLCFTVNVSPVDLEDRDFVPRIRQNLPATGGGIELELTETAMTIDRREVQDGLRSLKTSGMTLAIDDFGTGYSSLARLHDLPVDTLKIDQSFVRRLSERPDETAIIEAIVLLAERLKIRVVAEGIETAEQARLLSRLGVRVGQGYWIAPPLHEDELGAWLSADGRGVACA